MLERLIYSALDNIFSEDPIICLYLIAEDKELLLEKLQFISEQKWCLNHGQEKSFKVNREKIGFNFKRYLLLTDFKFPGNFSLYDLQIYNLFNSFAFFGNTLRNRNYWNRGFAPDIVSICVIGQNEYHKATLHITNQEHRFIYHCDRSEIQNLRLTNYSRNHIKPMGEQRLSYFYIQQLLTRKLTNTKGKLHPTIVQLQMPSNLNSHHKTLLGYREWSDNELRQMAVKSIQKPILKILKLLVETSSVKGEIPMNHFKDLEYLDWFRIQFCEIFSFALVDKETNIFSYRLGHYGKRFLESLL